MDRSCIHSSIRQSHPTLLSLSLLHLLPSPILLLYTGATPNNCINYITWCAPHCLQQMFRVIVAQSLQPWDPHIHSSYFVFTSHHTTPWLCYVGPCIIWTLLFFNPRTPHLWEAFKFCTFQQEIVNHHNILHRLSSKRHHHIVVE